MACLHCGRAYSEFNGERGARAHESDCLRRTSRRRDRFRLSHGGGDEGVDGGAAADAQYAGDGGGMDQDDIHDPPSSVGHDDVKVAFGSEINRDVAALYARRPDLSKGLLEEMLAIFSPRVPELLPSASRLLASVDSLPGIMFQSSTITLQRRPLRAGEEGAAVGGEVQYNMEYRDVREVIRRSCELHGATAKPPVLTDLECIDDVTTARAYQAQLRKFQHVNGERAVLVPFGLHLGQSQLTTDNNCHLTLSNINDR